MDHPTTKPASSGLGATVWLVTAAAILVPSVLLLWGSFVRGMQVWADQKAGPHTGGPAPEPPNEGTPYYIAAAVTAVVLAALGIGLSLRSGQVVSRWLLGAVLVVTALVVVANNIEPAPPPERHGPLPCQEHSGGDTTCPGG
jgi:hypothetical protein